MKKSCQLRFFLVMSLCLLSSQSTQTLQKIKNFVSSTTEFSFDMAIRFGYPNIVKFFIQRGIDVTAHDNRALLIAIQNNRPEIVDMLIKAGAHYPLGEGLGMAARWSHAEIVKILIDSFGASDINRQQGPHHDTPLEAALQNSQYNRSSDVVRTIQLLLSAGADIDAVGQNSRVTADAYAQIQPVDLPEIQNNKRAIQSLIAKRRAFLFAKQQMELQLPEVLKHQKDIKSSVLAEKVLRGSSGSSQLLPADISSLVRLHHLGHTLPVTSEHFLSEQEKKYAADRREESHGST